MNTPIRKVMIANRGEIAVRIIRTCREMGIATVAVYSQPDRLAPHVRLADEAFLVGPAPAAKSYLNQETLLGVASRANVDAIHPGYGFLSENATFAEACQRAGLIFIGPPASAIRAMGDKTTARRLMADAGVPMAPGTPDAIDDPAAAREFADTIGYPVLIKAAAGGGGKGMRLVHGPKEFDAAMQMAQREAESAFGDKRVFLEKYLVEPRHIEFQILADGHGNVVHLFERECSIQRRHQKVVEEAPSVLLDEPMRKRMGDAAVAAARACGYENAGTVEFLVDRERNFYFMEVNTRLQVEHPVTELITGLDLVAEQIYAAEGRPLRFDQSGVGRSGHAIECRIYAEDPDKDFLPSPGTLVRHAPPAGPGVRVDAGVDEGGDVLIHYDPMIAKLIVWGATRDKAIRRMERALHEYEVTGVRTTIPFCHFVMQHEAFRSGQISTHFVDEHYRPQQSGAEESEAIAAAVAAGLFASQSRLTTVGNAAGARVQGPQSDAWRSRRILR